MEVHTIGIGMKYPLAIENLVELSSLAYPWNDSTRSRFKITKCRFKFMTRFLIHYNVTKNYINALSKETLQLAVLAHRSVETRQPFMMKAFYPYLVSQSSVALNVKRIIGHYQFVENCLSTQVVDGIYNPNTPPLELTRLEIDGEFYSVILVCDGWCKQEGEVSLRLLTPEGDNFYMLHFLIDHRDGQRTMKIGALQGPKSSELNKHRIKRLTKSVFGLRPKDLLVRLGLYIADCWEVKQVLAIKNDQHVWFNKRYEKLNKDKQMIANFESHWRELGGTDFNQYFMSLPIAEHRKSIEEVTRTKRAMYRKRYAWLDEVHEQMRQTIACLTSDDQ